MSGIIAGWSPPVLELRDIEETPRISPDPGPLPAPAPKQLAPDFKLVDRDRDARPCYICGYPCREYAQYEAYYIILHYECWFNIVRLRLGS